MDYSWTGPLSYEQFMAQFLPPTPGQPSTISTTSTSFRRALEILATIKDIDDEDTSLKTLVEALAHHDKNMKYVYTGNNQSIQNKLLKPDVTVYRADTVPSELRCDFRLVEFNFEGKKDWSKSRLASKELDIFRVDPDQTETFRVQNEEAEKTRGQICAQLRMLMKCQHRTFAFTGFVTDRFVRLIYFDRSGACVSERILYRTEDGLEKLLRFFEALYRAEPPQRGLDETISTLARYPDGDDTAISRHTRGSAARVQEPDTDVLRFKNWWKASSDFLRACMQGEYEPWADVKDVILIKGSKGTYYICNGTPMHRSRNLLGRTTRCYIGIVKPSDENLKNYQAVLIKDHWRIDSEDLRAEGDTYDILRKVPELQPFLAELDEAGNVNKHMTQDDKFPERRKVDATMSRVDREKTIHHLIHYRMVFTTVGLPLSACTTPKQIVQILIGILEAHWLAYDKTRILHRDLSLYNCLWLPSGDNDSPRAVLLDWDLSKEIDNVELSSRQYRTGTWAFMSSRLLGELPWCHQYSDDLESVVWILIFILITRYPTTQQFEAQVGEYGRLFEDQDFDLAAQRVVGGRSKRQFLLDSQYEVLEFPGQPGINALIQGIGVLFLPFYRLPTRKLSDSLQFPELRNPEALITIMKNALKDYDWPEATHIEQDIICAWRERHRSDAKKRTTSFSAVGSSKPSKKSRRT